MTTGGTESILMAVKAYRDRARELRGITAPEMYISLLFNFFHFLVSFFDLKMRSLCLNTSTELKTDQTG
jgi:sphinganine-1-phosphate aldolase